MRIILDKDDFNKMISNHNLGSIQKLSEFKKTVNYSYFLNKNCFLRKTGNKLETVEIIDEDKQLVKYGDKEFLGDNSYFLYKKFDNLQIPTQLSEIKIQHTTYKIKNKSVVNLHITKQETGVISDIWFDVDKEYIDNQIMMEDINTFLEC